jgi:hypothetical protein
MNNEIQKKNTINNVLDAIDSGRVKMTPKWHFIIKAAFLIIGIVLAVLVVLYIISFIIFSLRVNGALFAPGFGFRGLPVFLAALPWLLISIALVFIVLLEFLVRKYSFAYRKPLLYSAIGVIILAGLGGAILDNTRFHDDLFLRVRENNLPLAGPFYRGYSVRRKDVIIGTITKIVSNGYHIQSPRDEDIIVVVTPDTRFPINIKAFVKGDTIVVLGNLQDDTITAMDIRKVDIKFPHPSREPYPFSPLPSDMMK